MPENEGPEGASEYLPFSEDLVDFAVAAFLEDGRWAVVSLPPHTAESLDALLSALSQQVSEGPVLGLVGLGDEYFVLALLLGREIRLFLSNQAVRAEDRLAGDLARRPARGARRRGDSLRRPGDPGRPGRGLVRTGAGLRAAAGRARPVAGRRGGPAGRADRVRRTVRPGGRTRPRARRQLGTSRESGKDRGILRRCTHTVCGPLEARDVDLDDIEDVAGLLEVMRETSEDEDFEPESAVLLLEQEDLWFAVIRTDVDEDPRVFVSDFTAASRSAYADLLFAAGLVPVGPDGRRLTPPDADADLDEIAGIGVPGAPDVAEDEEAEVATEDEAEDGGPAAEAGAQLDLDALGSLSSAYPAVEVISQSRSSAPAAPAVAGPAGDAELLTDFGVEAAALVDLSRDGLLPADALAELAEALGAADELEAVR